MEGPAHRAGQQKKEDPTISQQVPGHIQYMPLEEENKSQLKRSLIFLGHPLYYDELNMLTYKQEPRRSSTLKQQRKGKRCQHC